MNDTTTAAKVSATCAADYATRPLGRCFGCGAKGRWTWLTFANAWRCDPCGKVAP